MLSIDQIEAVMYPMAAGFGNQVDKELTTFTWSIHKDNWQKFLGIVLPQLLDPGFREDDFKRLKDAQLNALTQDLRSNNEEELGKERLQIDLFRGTPYSHTPLGTVAGLNAITLADVKDFARRMYTRANLTLAASGDVPPEMLRTVQANVGTLPEGPAAAKVAVRGRRPSGLEVEILEKDTRATAISFGHPIDVTRSHPDFAALSVARVWLGEHRIASGRLYQRLREIRGLNYGDYAYIEAFPRGMFQFFPDPNRVRQQQLFEIWIRPVVPANAHMSLRIALYELQKLIDRGLTATDFETTRNYLMKNVYVMTARQDQQLGYALDSRWYGIPEFTRYMRDGLQKLTVDGRERRHQAAFLGEGSLRRHHHEGCRRVEAGARVRRAVVHQIRRREAEGAAGGGQGDRGDEADHRSGEDHRHSDYRSVREVIGQGDCLLKAGDVRRLNHVPCCPCNPWL